jgi:hypothetical protein
MQPIEHPIVFGAPYSVYVRTVRLALEEKAVQYELVPVDVFASEGTPSEHKARHPFGKIPAFEYAGFRLYEAGAITRYVDVFACNTDPSGIKDIEPSPVLRRCLSRHTKDYAQLSARPDQFATFAEAIRRMQRTEPNYSVHDLAEVHVPIAIVQAEHDEFIS